MSKRLLVCLALVACKRGEQAAPRDSAPAPIDAPHPDAATAIAVIDAGPTATPQKLVAANDTTCALMSDLTVRCWGGNAHGTVGNNTTSDTTTAAMPEIRHVKDLAMADDTVCAMLDDASVACWGKIAWHGKPEDTLRPSGVLGVITVQQVFAADGARACSRTGNQSLVCWGNVNAAGHFTQAKTARQPTPVVGVDHVVALVTDGALADDGRMWAWKPTDGTPRIVDAQHVTEIAERDGTVCGRLASGGVACTGAPRCEKKPAPPPPPPPPKKPAKPTKTKGKPGKVAKKPPEKKPPPPPEKPKGEPVETPAFPAARQLAFDFGFCVVTTGDKLVCGDGCKKLESPLLDKVDHVVGRCAVRKDGSVRCLEDGKLHAVTNVSHPTSLAVGRAHACAITDGQIRCWGNNDHGQVGDFVVPP